VKANNLVKERTHYYHRLFQKLIKNKKIFKRWNQKIFFSFVNMLLKEVYMQENYILEKNILNLNIFLIISYQKI
jgi:hypothetical protein